MDIRILTELVNQILRLIAKRTEVKTPIMSSVTSSGSVSAEYSSVTLITSSNFSGTILGTTATASTTYTFCSNGNPLSAISYTISAGTIQIIAM